MENIGANKTLGDLSWEELLNATSSETLRDERLKDQASFAGKVAGKMKVESGEWAEIQKKGRSIGGKKGGKITGKITVQSGRITKMSSQGGTASQKVVRECPHCTMKVKGTTYFGKHGDRCKLKGFVPNLFISKVKEGQSINSLSKEYGISRGFVRSLIAQLV